MHYEDKEKIDAETFLKTFEVDSYLLDDLNEYEIDIKDRLFADEAMNSELAIKLANVLEKYVHVVNSTIEFKDIAYSLDILANTLREAPIDELDREKRVTLNFYIQGLVDDLSEWKKYIFIEANAPDIHYLDASLLDNCMTIREFITSSKQSEDESNELEFF